MSLTARLASSNARAHSVMVFVAWGLVLLSSFSSAVIAQEGPATELPPYQLVNTSSTDGRSIRTYYSLPVSPGPEDPTDVCLVASSGNGVYLQPDPASPRLGGHFYTQGLDTSLHSVKHVTGACAPELEPTVECDLMLIDVVSTPLEKGSFSMRYEGPGPGGGDPIYTLVQYGPQGINFQGPSEPVAITSAGIDFELWISSSEAPTGNDVIVCEREGDSGVYKESKLLTVRAAMALHPCLGAIDNVGAGGFTQPYQISVNPHVIEGTPFTTRTIYVTYSSSCTVTDELTSQPLLVTGSTITTTPPPPPLLTTTAPEDITTPSDVATHPNTTPPGVTTGDNGGTQALTDEEGTTPSTATGGPAGATFHTVYILLPLVLMVLLVACTVVLYVAWRLWRRRRRRLPKSKENNITEENPEQDPEIKIDDTGLERDRTDSGIDVGTRTSSVESRGSATQNNVVAVNRDIRYDYVRELPRTRGESLSETESEGSDVNLLMREIKKDTTAIRKEVTSIRKHSNTITSMLSTTGEAVEGLSERVDTHIIGNMEHDSTNL